MTPGVLGPEDYNSLADHLNRLGAETDCAGLRYFSPYTGAPRDAHDPEKRKQSLLNWACPVGEAGWQKVWGLRIDGGGPVVAHLELAGPGLPIKQHRAGVTLGVEAAFRRQGCGGSLLREAIGFARGAGLAWLDLWVFAHNAPALALYNKIGFAEAGRFEDAFRLGSKSIEDVAMVLRLV
ncbi:MAG: GNAT family N-acetyltransferase [Beijerinckiaceae bacterium]|nr:GNAT family N-acetyltransferase [Beijerinckiaceae bacterium]